MRLAERLGVCANLDFQFPGDFSVGDGPTGAASFAPTSTFDRPVLHWRLMALLRESGTTPCFAPVRAYLGDGRDDFRRYELACRIADCFDQYLIYRPDWITRWEDGRGGSLAGGIVATAGARRRGASDAGAGAVSPGVATAATSTAAACRNGSAIIGVSALPPLYLELLADLAHFIDVHLLLLNPCQEYWGDIQAERDLARLGEELDPTKPNI